MYCYWCIAIGVLLLVYCYWCIAIGVLLLVYCYWCIAIGVLVYGVYVCLSWKNTLSGHPLPVVLVETLSLSLSFLEAKM